MTFKINFSLSDEYTMTTYLEYHTLFAECIEAFRNELAPESSQPGTVESMLLTPFKVDTQWDLGICKIASSKEIRNEFGYYTTFASIVYSPSWINTEKRGPYSVALASVISFVSLRTFKSAEKNLPYFDERIDFDDFLLHRLGFAYPLRLTGPTRDVEDSRLSQDRQIALCNEIKEFVQRLHDIEHKKYQKVMQSVRLVHLSLLNREVDFGLSYLLVVAAIESIAQEAIKRKSEKHSKEDEWKQCAKENPLVQELLKAYKETRGKDQRLKERFVQFILEYAPPSEWKNFVRHPYQD
ncbi:MAG: hypothetical protein WA958_05610, partial [Tunicatimonas sp.]